MKKNYGVAKKEYNKTGKVVIKVIETTKQAGYDENKITKDYFYSMYVYSTKKSANDEKKRLEKLYK